MKSVKFLVAIVGLIVGGQAFACTGPRLIIDSYWLINGDSAGGSTAYTLGVEVALFAPTTPTECVAGLGIQSPTMLGIDVLGASVAVANPNVSGIGSPLTAFSSLLASAAATADLSSTFPAGGVWFGFSGLVDPFIPPPLAPDEVYKLWFDLLVPDASISDFFSSLTFLSFATGSTDPLHPVELLGTTSGATGMRHVTEPGTLILFMGATLVMFVLHRRRRSCQALL